MTKREFLTHVSYRLRGKTCTARAPRSVLGQTSRELAFFGTLCTVHSRALGIACGGSQDSSPPLSPMYNGGHMVHRPPPPPHTHPIAITLQLETLAVSNNRITSFEGLFTALFTSNRRRLPPSNRRRLPSNRRRLPSNRRRLPSNRRRLPFNRRRLPSNRRRLPSNPPFKPHVQRWAHGTPSPRPPPHPIAITLQLETLAVSNNRITSFEGLSYLPKLRVLSLNNNDIDSFENFPLLPSLYSINLAGNPVADLPDYRRLTVAVCNRDTLCKIDGEEVLCVAPCLGWRLMLRCRRSLLCEVHLMSNRRRVAAEFCLRTQRLLGGVTWSPPPPPT